MKEVNMQQYDPSGFLVNHVSTAFSPLTGARNIHINLSASLVSGCLIIHNCFFKNYSLVLIRSN